MKFKLPDLRRSTRLEPYWLKAILDERKEDQDQFSRNAALAAAYGGMVQVSYSRGGGLSSTWVKPEEMRE